MDNTEMRVIINKDVLMREVEGESVIMNLKNDRCFNLDEVGTRIWSVMTSTESIKDTVEILLSEFDVERKILENDVQVLISELQDCELILLIPTSEPE